VEDVFLRENDVKELLEMERGLNLLRNDCSYVLQMSSMAGNFVVLFFFVVLNVEVERKRLRAFEVESVVMNLYQEQQ
jgi:hypothetical protein